LCWLVLWNLDACWVCAKKDLRRLSVR
jgi:hypothetical protein